MQNLIAQRHYSCNNLDTRDFGAQRDQMSNLSSTLKQK